MLRNLFGKKKHEQAAARDNKSDQTSTQLPTEGILVGPIQSFEEDKLNMAGPALALAKLLAEVEPPFTVGLRGDWGSGKSSMLQMVKSLFDASHGTDNASQGPDKAKWQRARRFRDTYANSIKVIEFNPWANSELFRGSDLSKLLLERFIEELEVAGMITEALSQEILPVIGQQALDIVAHALITRLTSDDGRTADKVLGNDPEHDKVIYSDDLRNRLEMALQNSENETKILFLIDDLDRLPPDEAVKILDVITSLLKMPKCLFLIAVDQDVIANAVKEKLTDKAARNYFEKVFNVSIRISNTLSNRQLSELVAKPLGTGEQNQTIPKLVQAVVELCAFRNPRTLKRLMWLAHYRQIENAEARLFIGTIDNPKSAGSPKKDEPENEKVTAIDELCAALGAVEDAYGTFHSLVFPAIPHNSGQESSSETNDHAALINAALRVAALRSTADLRSAALKAADLGEAAKEMAQKKVEDEATNEINYFLEQYPLDATKDDINAKAQKIISSLVKPHPIPPGIDEHEQEEVFAQTRANLTTYFRDITDKLLPPPVLDDIVSNPQASSEHKADDIYASRRSSGWMATYMATNLWQYRRAIGGHYSLPQQIYRYMSRDWDFASIYIDTYSGFLKHHIDSFVIYVGARAMEIYFKAPDTEQTKDFKKNILDSNDLQEQIKLAEEEGIHGHPESTPSLISFNEKRAPHDDASILLFRFAYEKRLEDNEEFEKCYDRLTEMATTVLQACIEEFE